MRRSNWDHDAEMAHLRREAIVSALEYLHRKEVQKAVEGIAMTALLGGSVAFIYWIVFLA